MPAENPPLPPYAALLLRLLQGVVYDEDRRAWERLLAYQAQIRAYFATIGLELLLNEAEGFAFLTQPDELDGQPNPLPRLTRRIPLSYEVTLLLVLLREALEEFDVANTDSRRLFLTDAELKERIEVFFTEQDDRVKLLDRFDQYINAVANLGFLREVQVKAQAEAGRTFEVRRIVKAKITNEKLDEIKAALAAGHPAEN